MPDVGKENLMAAGGGFFADTADVVVDTALLQEDEWHKYRAMGIGGSDAAAVFNASPWTSAYGLYLKKTGSAIKDEVIDAGKQFIFEYGHIMEPLVADTFQRITGFEVMIDTYMYRHKDYPFMQANIDRVVRMPDGKLALLECKTTTFFNKEAWENGNIPRYYKLQCQHYMAILNVDVCYIACIYGNTLNDFVCRRIDRNMEEEEALIAAERNFWEKHVLAGSAPAFSGNGVIETNALLTAIPYANKNNPKMEFSEDMEEYLQKWVELHTKKKEVEKVLASIENEMLLAALPVKEIMGDTTKGYYSTDGVVYNVDFSPRSRGKVDAERLKLVYPDVYNEVYSENKEAFRVFSIKSKKAE